MYRLYIQLYNIICNLNHMVHLVIMGYEVMDILSIYTVSKNTKITPKFY